MTFVTHGFMPNDIMSNGLSQIKKTYQAVDSHQIEETVLLFYRFQCVLNSKRIEKSDNFRLSSVVAFKKLPKRPFYVEWT